MREPTKGLKSRVKNARRPTRKQNIKRRTTAANRRKTAITKGRGSIPRRG